MTSEYYLLHLGPINDGYAESYDFNLPLQLSGTEEQCRQLFFSEMKEVYSDLWLLFRPQSVTDIDIDTVNVNLKLHTNNLQINMKTTKTGSTRTSLKLLSYSTNGGLHSGFGALLLPKGQILAIDVIF